MFMLHKRRARKPLATDRAPTIGFAPNGVGGIEGKELVVSITVGEYTLFATKEHFDALVKNINVMVDDYVKYGSSGKP